MQDQAILREYEKAKRIGAHDFCGAIHFANPHLSNRLSEIDDKLKAEEAASIKAYNEDSEVAA